MAASGGEFMVRRLLAIACLALSVQAATPGIVATATRDSALRILAPSPVCELRAQVFSPSGALILDSGWRAGNLFDWNAVASLADGDYRLVVDTRNIQADLSSSESNLRLSQGIGTILPQRSNESGINATVTFLAHDGTTGVLIDTAGDLAFRFGNAMNGEDVERVRITAGGNVGIGTSEPRAPLDVKGLIRTDRGIEFPDGTILKSAEGLPGAEAADATDTAAVVQDQMRILTEVGGITAQPSALHRKPKTNTSPDFQFQADAAGVHIGTTPAYGLDVAGDVVLGTTLTIPSTSATGGIVEAGAIMQNTASLLHTYPSGNIFVGANAGNFTTTSTTATAVGQLALASITNGVFNTAVGSSALKLLTSGTANTAIGTLSLSTMTTGTGNTAVGSNSLKAVTTAGTNTAVGNASLISNTTGDGNTAVGVNALNANVTGIHNVALGQNAGKLVTGNSNISIGNDGVAAESNTIRIGTSGTHTKTFISGIRGVSTGQQNAIAVLIDSNGQLGTTSSSRRFKMDIEDAAAKTNRLLELRPVTFRYREHGPDSALQYGLIAEEVAEVYPELVAYDANGQPETVLYQFLPPMLLSAVQTQEKTIAQANARIEALESQLAAQNDAISRVMRRLAELEKSETRKR
jgi:hypothetical protein